ncbi:MAG: DUF192 domain-containing protein [Phycisphaerae bacterium]|nr:DUF192 domain-containing protein [Phycisphaerae bacterium]
MCAERHLHRILGAPRRKAVALVVSLFFYAGCTKDPAAGQPGAARNDLSTMQTARVMIGDDQFEVWLAKTHRQRELGLMRVQQEELASFQEQTGQDLSDIHRGMLFVFDFEQPLSFWMSNTIIPLDIAYIRNDGRIVAIYTMAPLETRTYPSGEPARWALEVKAGLFASLGVRVGDHVQIPDSVLKDVLR